MRLVILSVLLVAGCALASSKRHQHHHPGNSGDEHLKKRAPAKIAPKTLAKAEWVKMNDYRTAKDIDCPRRCPKHKVCAVDSGKRKAVCVKKHHIKVGESLFKNFHPKSSFELSSSKVDAAHQQHMKDVRFHQHKNHHSSHHKHYHHINDKKPHLTARARVSPLDVHQNNVAARFIADYRNHLKDDKRSSVCKTEQLDEMRKRLTGWFVLLHAQYREHHKHGPTYHTSRTTGNHHGNHSRHHFSVKKELNSFHHSSKCNCIRSVVWEFKHLDIDGNRHINHTELSRIENNNMEPCVKPFIDSCDHNKDLQLSRHEWCCCFASVKPPCYAHLRKLRAEKSLRDAFIPLCDRDGYYEKRQCHSGACWCVDLNGNEVYRTRTTRTPHCDKLDVMGHPFPK